MAMGRRKKRARQGELWLPAQELARSAGHPFYERLNTVLDEHGFDEFAEQQCRRFYAEKMGRPSITPGTYFRLLLVGYFEGIDSERGIAWRVADSLSLRQFLGYGLDEATPDHSTISRNRRLIDLETHQEVFGWVLEVLAEAGLVQAQTVAIDATTLEANAAMKSIVRRDTGERYDQYLRRLAAESGVETPTRQELARRDRRRKGKASNDDWQNPNDPDARITKMKDGRTHLAYKAEHAVDVGSGAVVGVTVQPADTGDTDSIGETLEKAQEASQEVNERGIEEVVADRGYHSGRVIRELRGQGIRSYVAEPRRKRQHWAQRRREQPAVYGNRRRVQGERGKRLQRKRGELVERSFAHIYDTGGLRRLHLRGRQNVLKRVLVQVGAFNLGLLMRACFGAGKPKRAADRNQMVEGALKMLVSAIRTISALLERTVAGLKPPPSAGIPEPDQLAAA
jgi:transposase